MRDKSYRADVFHLTPSDFTVMVSGLRREDSPEFLSAQIREWFTKEFGGEKSTEDHKVRNPLPLRTDTLLDRTLAACATPHLECRRRPRCASLWGSSVTTA